MHESTFNIEDLDIDIESLIVWLRDRWVSNKNFELNPTAFTKITRRGRNIMFCCPFHADNNPSSAIMINPPYIFNCFACGGFSLPAVIAYVMDIPEVIAERLLKNKFSSYVDRKYPNLVDKFRNILEQNQKKSKNVYKMSRQNSEDDIKYFMDRLNLTSYLRNRGFSDHTLLKYEVGYDDRLDTITFPVRDTAGTLRFIKRRYTQQKKFLNERGVEKRDVVYGLNYLTNHNYHEIFLTESETDTLSCYQQGLIAGATLGKVLFKEQVYELAREGFQIINLFYDNDEAGRDGIHKAYSLITKIAPIKVNVVQYPNSLFKDANDLLRANQLGNIELISYLEFKRKDKERGNLLDGKC